MLDPISIEFAAPDPDEVCRNYFETCRRLDIESVPRERAQGLLHEWGEVLSGRPDPTQQ